ARHRHALDPHVAAGDQRAQHRVDHLPLADARLADLGAHRRGDLRRLLELLRARRARLARNGTHLFPLSSAAWTRCAVLMTWMKAAPRIAPPALRRRSASALDTATSPARRSARSLPRAAANSGCARATRRSAASRPAMTRRSRR